MPMTLIETTFAGSSIRVRLANDPNLDQATEWAAFEVPTAHLMIDEHNKLGDPAKRHLATIQRAALRYVRDAISDEAQRLAALIDR